MVSLWRSYALVCLCGLVGSGGIFPKFDCFLCILLAGIIKTLLACFIQGLSYVLPNLYGDDFSRQGKYKDLYFLNQLVFHGMSLVGSVSTAHLNVAYIVDPLRFTKKAKNCMIPAALLMPFVSIT